MTRLLHALAITVFCWAPLVSAMGAGWLLTLALGWLTFTLMVGRPRETVEAVVREFSLTNEQMIRMLYYVQRVREAQP